MSNDQKQLQDLLHGGHPSVFIPTTEEEYALGLIRRIALDQGFDLQIWTIIDGLRDGLVEGQPPFPETSNLAAALYFLRKQSTRGLFVLLDPTAHLKDERTLRLARESVGRFGRAGAAMLMIDHRNELPDGLASETTRFEISLPNEREVESIVRETLRLKNLDRPPQESLRIEIKKSVFQSMIRNLGGLNRSQVRRIIEETIAPDARFDESDLNTVLTRKRQALHEGGLLEFIEAPVDMEEIGGIHRLKGWLRQRSRALTDEAAAFGLTSPRGVLLLGVQGAGKSFCAKAIATAWQRPLMRMDVGALYDRYIGESERRLRDALRQAERMSPVILWVDEIEKCFASAASHNTDGGLSQRMFGMLLTWMQEHRSAVFIVATANDIGALPPELLRKGRFDEIFFVDLPMQAARQEIFSIHLRKRRREPKLFELEKLATASEGYSGAEIEQAIIAAMHDAFSAGREIDDATILKALRESPPLSVTMAEDVQELREWARDRCVPAG